MDGAELERRKSDPLHAELDQAVATLRDVLEHIDSEQDGPGNGQAPRPAVVTIADRWLVYLAALGHNHLNEHVPFHENNALVGSRAHEAHDPVTAALWRQTEETA